MVRVKNSWSSKETWLEHGLPNHFEQVAAFLGLNLFKRVM